MSDFCLQIFGLQSLSQVLYYTVDSEKITEGTNNVILIFLLRSNLL